MEGLLTKVMYDVPSDPTITDVTITKACVDGNAEPTVLHDPEKVAQRAKFEDRHGGEDLHRPGVLTETQTAGKAKAFPAVRILPFSQRPPSGGRKEATMETITRNIPVLALRGLTAFPGQTVSFDAERDISIFALDNAMENDRRLLAMTQKDLSTAEPGEADLYTIGTVCHILQIIKTSDTTVRVIAEGESRARLHRLWQKKPFLQAQAELLPEMAARHTARSEALIRRTYVLFGEYRELANGIGEDFAAAVLDCSDTGRLADLIAQNITLRHQDRQRVLEELHPDKRLRIVNDILTHEVDVISLESEMEQKVRRRVAQVQKDMILREQVKVLQHELGDDGDEELEEYAARIQAADLPEEIHTKLTKEVERLGKQPFGSAEASVIRNYLGCVPRAALAQIHPGEGGCGPGQKDTGQGPLRPG